jgi:hypothetical protein
MRLIGLIVGVVGGAVVAAYLSVVVELDRVARRAGS